MRIDAHHHLWRYRARDYPWMSESMGILRRDYLVEDLEAVARPCGIQRSIVVQSRQDHAETRWLLELAGQRPMIAGVVGWVDLCADDAGPVLADFARDPHFKGVRHLVHDEPDDRFLRREDFRRGISSMAALDLVYELLIFPRHLRYAQELVRDFPDQTFVLDHIAKPPIEAAEIEPWASEIRALAAQRNVSCKISGLVTEAHRESWTPEHLRPYLDVVFECFGEDRLLFGSDWPVCLLAASYERVVEVIEDYAQQLSALGRDKLFSNNARDLYRLAR